MIDLFNCRWVLIFASFLLSAAAAQQAVAQSASFERPPIDYLNTPVNDAVAQLAKRVEEGSIQLRYDSRHGYLPAVLEALNVPVESQTLVFSKTSLQLRRITPRTPRALYFNDSVYVGWCQKGEVVELAATDAKQGAIFYTLEQDPDHPPTFTRDRGQCLTCHASSRTQDVPGYLVRSVYSDTAGNPLLGSGTFTTDNTSPFKERWGGWYVTGTHGEMRHMGNAMSRGKGEQSLLDIETGANVTNLDSFVRTTPYLSPHSDIVALMVLEHQTQMHNALAAANYETREAIAQTFEMNRLLDRPMDHISESANRRIEAAAERVVKRLLMCGDFPLTSPVQGTSGFAEKFVEGAARDTLGRSLRDLDLQSRLFRFPCSYLVYSDSFQELPVEVKSRILQKLVDVLTSVQPTEGFEHMTTADRTAVLQILRETSVL
jgi:hypothetical protein